MAHSKGDDNRDKKEIEQYWEKDPLRRFTEEHAEEARHIQEEVKQRIDAALAELKLGASDTYRRRRGDGYSFAM